MTITYKSVSFASERHQTVTFARKGGCRGHRFTEYNPHASGRHVSKRTEILKAAVDIFGTKGSVNGTLADVAEQVGMTHAGILHHFGSKQNLLLEMLAYRDQADVQDLDEKHIPGGPELFLHLVRTAFGERPATGHRAGLHRALS